MNAPAETKIRALGAQMVKIGKSLYRAGYLAGSDGNISARMNEKRILITPSGARKGELSESDLIEVDLRGSKLNGRGKPSSESAMHLEVYSRRPEIQACVHSHAPHATAFSVVGIQPELDVLPEVVAFVGEIFLTEYAPPGTEEVGKSLYPGLESANAFLLKNHGLLTIGQSLEQAYARHEIVEHYLRILTIARSLGSIDRLEPSEIKRLRQLANNPDTA